MRTIKFRGKSIETGEWVYGYYVNTYDRHRIIYEVCEGFCRSDKINPETVGQYTGLRDKNGTEIYEGDIFQSNLPTRQIGKVFYENGCYYVLWVKNNPFEGIYTSFLSKVHATCKIIGNIYEHPHLLEGEE